MHEFEAAERKQPRYAAAHAGIASSYILLTYYGYLPPNQAAPRARTASLKALEFDDRLPEAHISLGGIYDGYDHRWADAEDAYRAALRLNPNHPTAHQWYANLLIARDRREEAQAHILRARELDPLSLIIQANVANVFLLSRQYDRAILECRKALEMEEEFVVARWVLGRGEELKGRYQVSAAEFERALQREPDNTLLRAALARTYTVSGARAKATEHLQTLKEAAHRRYVSPLDLVAVHAALGQTDEAFASLERAVRDRANLLKFLKVDPAYDSLRGDPRFSRILGMIGLESGDRHAPAWTWNTPKSSGEASRCAGRELYPVELKGLRDSRGHAPDVTGLLDEWTRGDRRALDRLLPLVYAELRRVAARQLRRERERAQPPADGARPRGVPCGSWIGRKSIGATVRIFSASPPRSCAGFSSTTPVVVWRASVATAFVTCRSIRQWRRRPPARCPYSTWTMRSGAWEGSTRGWRKSWSSGLLVDSPSKKRHTC